MENPDLMGVSPRFALFCANGLMIGGTKTFYFLFNSNEINFLSLFRGRGLRAINGNKGERVKGN